VATAAAHLAMLEPPTGRPVLQKGPVIASSHARSPQSRVRSRSRQRASQRHQDSTPPIPGKIASAKHQALLREPADCTNKLAKSSSRSREHALTAHLRRFINFVNVRSNWFAKACKSFWSNGLGPEVSSPAERNCSIRFRAARRECTLFSSYNSPRVPIAIQSFSTTRAARGISPVITTSPGWTRSTIALSATSGPPGTVIRPIKSESGIQIDWFATRTVSICKRSAVRKISSLICAGQASASTHSFMRLWTSSLKISIPC
jgi:hypothetical protein